MARRLAVLALATCLGVGASACGGDEEPAAAPPQTRADATAPGDATALEEAGSPRRRAQQREPAPTDAEEAPDPDDGGRSKPDSDERAGPDARRSLTRAKRVVRTIVGMISAADARVCRAFFTRRYAELVSGKRGDAAFRQCESDVGRSKGRLEVSGFDRSRVSGNTAVVRFRLEVGKTATKQGWRMVFAGGDWLVDGER